MTDNLEKEYVWEKTENIKNEKQYQNEYYKEDLEKKTRDEEEPISVILPPPNITGNLHLGHAYEAIIEDIIIRYFNLIGKKTNWIIGLDHAGIAAQKKIDSLFSLEESSKKKKMFLEKEWIPKTKSSFFKQWEELNLHFTKETKEKCSFTLGEQQKKQTKEAFLILFREKFIYRDYQLINWDWKTKTAISDIEVESKKIEGTLYYLKYWLVDRSDYILVATSRPETIFADIALFVNPSDKRYTKFLNKLFINPCNRKITLLFDDNVDIEFGSGVLKCTPGHDKKDYVLAKKHNLPIVTCCDERGILNSLAGGEWEGKEIRKIREDLIKKLKESGFIVNEKKYDTILNYSGQSNVPIEVFLSKQWFLDLEALVDKIEEKNPNFIENIAVFPSNQKKELLKWKEKAERWCISRQIWWGHKIPVLINKKDQKMFGEGDVVCSCIKSESEVIKTHLNICPFADLEPVEDVLDTWFSSSLWPLISQENDNGLPKNISPSLLVTGYDILFFWVLKMIVFGFYFNKKSPFKEIYVHGLIRDEKGKKMSKSFGNGIDPSEIIKKYGSDSLRMFFASGHRWGSDLVFSEQKVKRFWRVCKKMWSVAYFLNQKLSNERKKIALSEIFKED